MARPRGTPNGTPARQRGGWIANPEWQARAKAAIAALGMTEKEFATRRVRCAQSTLHDVLNVPNKSSHLIPKINRLFKWEEPPDVPSSPPVLLLSPDAVEFGKMFDQMPEELRRVKYAEMMALHDALLKKNAND